MASYNNNQKNKVISLKVSDRVGVNIAEFQDKLWFHLRDNRGKSFSLNLVDLTGLFARKREMLEVGNKLQQQRKKLQKRSTVRGEDGKKSLKSLHNLKKGKKRGDSRSGKKNRSRTIESNSETDSSMEEGINGSEEEKDVEQEEIGDSD